MHSSNIISNAKSCCDSRRKKLKIKQDKQGSLLKVVKVDEIVILGASNTGGAMGPCPPPRPPLFCVAKRKKGDKDKKERVSKQKLLNGSHQSQNISFSHSRASRIQKFFLSPNHGGWQ